MAGRRRERGVVSEWVQRDEKEPRGRVRDTPCVSDKNSRCVAHMHGHLKKIFSGTILSIADTVKF